MNAVILSFTECRYVECHYTDFHYAECYYAECYYAECHYGDCQYAECHVLIIVVLSFFLPVPVGAGFKHLISSLPTALPPLAFEKFVNES
jgi:hypothetical protein